MFLLIEYFSPAMYYGELIAAIQKQKIYFKTKTQVLPDVNML